MTLTEKAALLPDSDTSDLFDLLLEIAQKVDELTGVDPPTTKEKD